MSNKKVEGSTPSKVLDFFIDNDRHFIQKTLMSSSTDAENEVLQSKQRDITIRLHMKDFLQPFEEILAEKELEGLGVDVISKDKKSNILVIKSPTFATISRSTYFDWIVSDAFRPTLQACREGALPQASRIDPSFPRRR